MQEQSRLNFELSELKPNYLNDRKCKLLQIDGVGTLEVVIIIAVLMSVALLFRSEITSFATRLIEKVFDDAIISGI